MLSPFSNAETRTLETQSLVPEHTCQVMETSETKSLSRGRKNELWTIRFLSHSILALIGYKCRSVITCGHTIKIFGKQNMKTHLTPVSDHLLTFPPLPLSDHQPVLPECQPEIAPQLIEYAGCPNTPPKRQSPFPTSCFHFLCNKEMSETTAFIHLPSSFLYWLKYVGHESTGHLPHLFCASEQFLTHGKFPRELLYKHLVKY